jgi:hypothetical protein
MPKGGWAVHFLQSGHNHRTDERRNWQDQCPSHGAVLAEKLRLEGLDVTLVTPAGESLPICEYRNH